MQGVGGVGGRFGPLAGLGKGMRSDERDSAVARAGGEMRIAERPGVSSRGTNQSGVRLYNERLVLSLIRRQVVVRVGLDEAVAGEGLAGKDDKMPVDQGIKTELPDAKIR